MITGITTGVLEFDASEIRTDNGPVKEAKKGELVAFKVPERVRLNDKLFVIVKR